METRHRSRNYNLLVLCGMLLRLLEAAPEDGWVTRRQVLPLLEGLVGKEGLEELEEKIFDCSGEGFCIFDRREGERYHLASRRPPRLILTGDEAGLLLLLLRSGRGDFFLSPATRAKLEARLAAHREGEALPDLSPLAVKGASRLADDMAAVALGENYRLGAEAMGKGRGLRGRYLFDGEEREAEFFPTNFSFSPLDGRWRLEGVDPEGKRASFYLRNLSRLEERDWDGPREAPEEPRETAEILIREGKNTLDRASARFADWDKEIRETGDPAYPYRMKLRFPASQRRLAATRLLTLGAEAKVLTPALRRELLSMARSTAGVYEKAKESEKAPGGGAEVRGNRE